MHPDYIRSRIRPVLMRGFDDRYGPKELSAWLDDLDAPLCLRHLPDVPLPGKVGLQRSGRGIITDLAVARWSGVTDGLGDAVDDRLWLDVQIARALSVPPRRGGWLDLADLTRARRVVDAAVCYMLGPESTEPSGLDTDLASVFGADARSQLKADLSALQPLPMAGMERFYAADAYRGFAYTKNMDDEAFFVLMAKLSEKASVRHGNDQDTVQLREFIGMALREATGSFAASRTTVRSAVVRTASW